MSDLTRPTRGTPALLRRAGQAASEADERYTAAGGMRRQLNKVFPSQFTFLLGEAALYTFIILVLTGIYLTLFYDPSMTEVTYHGAFSELRGVQMSRAYESSLNISFAVRGGLFVRQIHHWAALVYVAAVAMHLFRVFFTGAFRRPREANWSIGILLLVLSGAEGFMGYSLPDDLLSGTGVRAALSGGVLSVPIIGTWIHWLFFGGEFPGNLFIPRFYSLHILLIPGLLLGLIAIHLGLVWYQKHTQFPGYRATENNVVGERVLPRFAASAGVWFVLVTAVMAVMGGVFQINPIFNYGPYHPGQVSTGAQPDWYMGWTEGLLRIWPNWEIYIGHKYLIPAPFFPLILGMTLIILAMQFYPAIEKKLTGDTAHHDLLQRPRDAPVRTGLGALGIALLALLTGAGGEDVIAAIIDVNLNTILWFFRIAVLVGPPLAYYVTYRICLGLQRYDRTVLEHGVMTGVVRRLPHGEFVEVHQPLGGVDEDGHPVPLDYQGASVPKKMNKLGAGGSPAPGSLLTPDPAEETKALQEARGDGEPGATSGAARGEPARRREGQRD
jgi:ubiquinol-cytochrome c reductase cytochrome b subunit